VTLTLIVILWNKLSTLPEKLEALGCGIGFGLVETTWTGIRSNQTVEVDLHPVVKKVKGLNKPVSIYYKVRKHGHTSWAQFLTTILWYPIGTVLYFQLTENHLILRYLCFPFSIWLLEILSGYYLSKIWNTRAWIYEKGPYTYFDQNITLKYFFYWIGLGLIHEFALFVFYRPLSVLVLAIISLISSFIRSSSSSPE